MAHMPPQVPARRNERARRAILAAARSLVAEVGFGKLTIEAIAARAGVGKQTIYRWWPSKGAVVFDAILAANADEAGSHALPDTGDVERDLKLVLRAIVAELIDPNVDKLHRAVTAEIQHDATLANELVERLLRPQIDATVQRLEIARARGQLDARVDARLGAELLYGPIFHRWLLRTAPLTSEFADQVVEVVLAGLAPRPH